MTTYLSLLCAALLASTVSARADSARPTSPPCIPEIGAFMKGALIGEAGMLDAYPLFEVRTVRQKDGSAHVHSVGLGVFGRGKTAAFDVLLQTVIESADGRRASPPSSGGALSLAAFQQTRDPMQPSWFAYRVKAERLALATALFGLDKAGACISTNLPDTSLWQLLLP